MSKVRVENVRVDGFEDFVDIYNDNLDTVVLSLKKLNRSNKFRSFKNCVLLYFGFKITVGVLNKIRELEKRIDELEHPSPANLKIVKDENTKED